jgi:hypothetical protein
MCARTLIRCINASETFSFGSAVTVITASPMGYRAPICQSDLIARFTCADSDFYRTIALRRLIYVTRREIYRTGGDISAEAVLF